MTRVKICGITNLADARIAVDAGADLLGFVFYPGSPRYLKPENAREIVTQMRARPDLRSDNNPLDADASASSRIAFGDRPPQEHGVGFIGVFVDEKPEMVARTLELCGLDYAQLHGDEPPETVTALVQRGYKVIKAFRVGSQAAVDEIARYRATCYLLDSYVPGQPGGTGQPFDWRWARRAAQYGPIILAGGLTPENVAEAIRTARPWGVDVSSGVEMEPGRKDPFKVRAFVAAAKRVTD